MNNFDSVTVKLYSEQDRKMQCLLDKAAKIKGTSPQELLRELTTFPGRGGKQVEGRDEIIGMSLRFQEVIFDKLSRIFKEEERICPSTTPDLNGGI
jgi:hypothetical protein